MFLGVWDHNFKAIKDEFVENLEFFVCGLFDVFGRATDI